MSQKYLDQKMPTPVKALAVLGYVGAALYARWGFTEQARRRGYYHRPVEDAVVMKRAAKNVLHANEA